jgi:TatD DNase family protein
MKLIDSHAHITSPIFKEDFDELLIRASQAGLEFIVNICTDKDSLDWGLEVAKENSFIRNVASTTPHDVEKDGEHFFPFVRQAALDKKLIAIGETGLDYYYEHAPRDLQKDFLRRYLRLAKEVNLPVVIHCRDAFEDFFSILDEEYVQDADNYLPGVLHCFTGTLDEAAHLVAKGWYISFSGIVTFKKSLELKEVAKSVPLENLLIETDSPYLAPPPYRGKRNEPAYVVEVAKCLAELKEVEIEELARVTKANTLKLFNL